MSKKTFTLRQKITFSLVIILIFLTIVFVIGELYAASIYEEPDTPYFGLAELDEELGWKPKENFTIEQTIKDSKGQEYQATFQSTRDGFREFGDVNSDKYKIFFIGDSYTQSVEVSNDQIFYNLMADSLPIEVFAFGQALWGNVQEYIIFDRFYDEIQPDLVVLQVCENDFIDNHYLLEWEALYGTGVKRPYLTTGGSIRRMLPIPYWENLVSKSKFLTLISTRLEILESLTRGERSIHDSTVYTIAEYRIPREDTDYEPFREAVEITRQIFKKFQKRIDGKSDFLIFPTSIYKPQNKHHREICAELGIPFYEEPARQVVYANAEGENVYAADKVHWNPYGQRKMADLLLPYIRQHIEQSDKAHLLEE